MTFQPGQSGNKLGRPRGAVGLAKYVASVTNNGQELVDKLLEIARSEVSSYRDKLHAIEVLLDRFAGKPLQQSEVLAIARVEHQRALPAGWSTMSPADRSRWLDQLEASAAKNANPIALLLDE